MSIINMYTEVTKQDYSRGKGGNVSEERREFTDKVRNGLRWTVNRGYFGGRWTVQTEMTGRLALKQPRLSNFHHRISRDVPHSQ